MAKLQNQTGKKTKPEQKGSGADERRLRESLGLDGNAPEPKTYECPKCQGQNAYMKEIHPDTDMNDIVLYCPDCKFLDEKAAEEFEHIDIEMQCKLSGEKQFAFGICKASEINEDERSVTAVISTGAIDRDGEVLDPKGIKLDNFIKNPVVPWSHNAGQPPIGKALWIKKGTKRIISKVKFAMTERAEEVWQLFKGGYLKAFSVGFMPLRGHRPTPEDIKKSPELADARFIFDEWELLEFSPVTVPANPEALAQAVKSHSIKLSDDIITELKVEAVAEPESIEKDADSDELEVVIPVKEFKPEKKEISVEPVFGIDKI